MTEPKFSLANINQLARATSTCEQCDEMFLECIGAVDPDGPLGYELCQIIWDQCKADCTGIHKLTRKDTRNAVLSAYAKALADRTRS